MTQKSKPSPFRSFGWMLADKIIKLGGGLVLGLLVARYLGPDDYGRLSIALDLSLFGKILVGFQMERVIQRDMTQRPDLVGAIAGSYTAICAVNGVILSLITSTIAYVFVHDPMARSMCYLLAWTPVPTAMGGANIWFESQGRMGRVTVGQNISWAFFALLRLVLVWKAAVVYYFGVLALVEWCTTNVVIAWIFARDTGIFGKLRIDYAMIRSWMKEVLPSFLGMILVACSDRVLQITIQHRTDITGVGHYYSAYRLADIWWDLANNASVAMLPMMALWHHEDQGRYRGILKRYAALSVSAPIVICIAVSIVAPFALPLVLGPKYQGSVPCLILLFWAGPAVYLRTVSAQHLTLTGRIRYTVVPLLANIVLAIPLVMLLAPLGAMGAALSVCAALWISTLVTPMVLPAVRDVAKLQLGALKMLFHPVELANEGMLLAKNLLKRKTNPS